MASGIRQVFGAVLVLLLTGGAATEAQEFQVNTYTPSDQSDPDTCLLDDGSFIVVWETFAQDGDGDGVFARRYSASGSPVGSEFQVSTYTVSNQFDPRVCCSGSGFVVAWASGTQDGHNSGVFAQRFDASSSPLGDEFQVNTYTPEEQSRIDLCCQADGRFVVTWSSYEQDGSDGGVFGQGFASSGAASGAEFQVNTYTTGYQSGPSVCCDGSGGFVVAWRSYGQDGDGMGVFAKAFSAPGTPAGGEFQVNTYTTSVQSAPDVCCEGSGFVVVWTGYDGLDGDGAGIFGQVFSGPASPVGAQFQVNTYTTDYQNDPAVCCGPDGFEVVWEDSQPGGDTQQLTGREYNGSGLPLGPPFVVTSYTSSDADDPVIACAPNGDRIVVWESDSGDTPPRDGSATGVFALFVQRLSILEIPTLGGWGLGLLATALAAGGAAFLRRR